VHFLHDQLLCLCDDWDILTAELDQGHIAIKMKINCLLISYELIGESYLILFKQPGMVIIIFTSVWLVWWYCLSGCWSIVRGWRMIARTRLRKPRIRLRGILRSWTPRRFLSSILMPSSWTCPSQPGYCWMGSCGRFLSSRRRLNILIVKEYPFYWLESSCLLMIKSSSSYFYEVSTCSLFRRKDGFR
jgi:hypothetical protein